MDFSYTLSMDQPTTYLPLPVLQTLALMLVVDVCKGDHYILLMRVQTSVATLKLIR